MESAALRVEYREKQRLRAGDLTAEQEYLIALERSHNTTLHTPGVVLGLGVREDGPGAPERQPGVAIDAQGRSVVLAQSQPVAIPPHGQCIDSWLVYCETAGSSRRKPGRGGTGDRWYESAQIVDNLHPESEKPFPPEPDAIYLGRRTATSAAGEIPCTSLTGGQACSTAGEVVMTIGPEHGRERDGFSLHVAGEANPRLAFDRLGSNRIYGTVTLSDYHLTGRLSRTAGEIVFEAPESRKVSGSLRLQLTHPAGGPDRITIFSGAQPVGSVDVHNGQPPADAVALFGGGQFIIRFQTPLTTIPIPSKDSAPARSAAQSTLAAGQESAFKETGGMLSLAGWPDAAEPRQADGSPTAPFPDPDGRGPNGLSFEPMPTAPAAPPLPGVYRARAGTDVLPTDQLRLDLGEKTGSELKVQMSIGARETDLQRPGTPAPRYRQWLVVSGKGTVHIAGSPDPAKASITQSLRVTGRIYRAPIKAGPSDPVFTALLLKAWVAGLQQAVGASPEVKLAFQLPPQMTIEAGKKWEYTLLVTNTADRPITIDGVVETLSVPGQPVPLPEVIPGSQQDIAAKGVVSILVKHDVNRTPVGMLTIGAQAFGKIGDRLWLKGIESDPVEVLPPPSIALDGFPALVPAGTPWSRSFKITNTSSQKLTLGEVTLTEGGVSKALPVPQPPGPVLEAGGFVVFTPEDDKGLTADRESTIKAVYKWNSNLESEVSEKKGVRIDLAASYTLPQQVDRGTSWDFDLTFRNTLAEQITLRHIWQRLSANGVPLLKSKITMTGSRTLDPGESYHQTHFAGMEVTDVDLPNAATLQFTVEVKYQVATAYILSNPISNQDIAFR